MPPVFLRLYARYLRTLGLEIPHESGDGTYQRFTGDTSGLGKGEILVWESGRPQAATG